MRFIQLFMLAIIVPIITISAQPILDSAKYDEEFNILKLYFDVPLNDGLMNTSGFVEVSVDEGTVEYQSITTPFSEVSSVADDNIIELQLTTPDATYLEGWSTVGTNLEVSLGASVFFDLGLYGNATVIYTNNISVDYLTTEPEVLNARYDAEIDKLEITFTRALNDASTDTYASVGFSVDEGSVNTRTLFTPLSESSEITNDNKLIIDVSSSDAAVIEWWPNLSTNLELSLSTSFVSSLSSSTGNILMSYVDNIPITYVPQEPAIDSATYDSETNILHLVFNRKLNDGSINTYETVTLSRDNGSSSVTLMTPFGLVARVVNDNKLDIHVGASDATVIEGWTGLENLEVQVGNSLVQSQSGYYNLAHTFADDRAVEYIIENPVVTYSEYDAENDQVIIHFNRDLDDASLDTYASGGLSVDNAGDNYIYFNTPFSDVSAVADDSIIVIQLSAGTATTIEGWSNLETDLELEITTNMVQSESGYYNSAFSYVDDISVKYNSANPKLIKAFYDADVDLLHLAFDRPLNDANFNSSPSLALSVDNGGTYFQYLTTPLTDISAVGYDSIVEFQLSSGDATNIEGWANLERDLEIDLSSSMVESNSGFTNQYYSYSDDFQVDYIPAAPALDSVTYYAEFNKLVMYFNRDLNDVNFNTSGSIYLSVDEGALYYEWINNPLTDVSAVANDNVIELNLLSSEGTNVEGWSNLETNLKIEISGTLVQSQNGFNNQNCYYSDNERVRFVLGDPLINSASYDAETDILTLNFDHDVNDATFNIYAGIGLSVDNETSNYMLLSTPLTQISDVVNDTTLQIQVNSTNASTIEGWPDLSTKLKLEFADSVINCFNGLTNHWYTYDDDISIEYIAREPMVTSSLYDAESNQLIVHFNRQLNDAMFDTYGTIGLSADNQISEYIVLTTPLDEISTGVDDSIIVIQLSGSNASAIEGWSNLNSDLELEITSNLVRSQSGFYNQYLYYNNNISVEYNSANPKLSKATYDADVNELALTFDRSLNDAALDTYASIGLSVDDGGIDYLYLTTPITEISSLGNDSIVVIQVSTGNATTIEGWSNLSTDLEVEITSNLAQSHSGFYNEYVYYSDDFQVQYIPPEPQIISAVYYAKHDLLSLTYNRSLNDAFFDPYGLIGLSVDEGATNFINLSTPMTDICQSDNDSTISLKLTVGQASTLEGWPDLETGLEVENGGNLVKSTSGFYNSYIYYSDDVKVQYDTVVQLPSIITNNTLVLNEGDSAVIPLDSLKAVHKTVDELALLFEITSPFNNGVLKNSDSSGAGITTFTQADLNNNKISYIHDGSNTVGDSILFKVSDGTNELTGQLFKIVINPVNDKPVLVTSIDTIKINEGDTLVQNFIATDEDPEDTLIYSLTGPAGMSISDTGLVTWITGSDDSGSYSVTVKVADDSLAEDSDTFVVVVNNVPIITKVYDTTYNNVKDTTSSVTSEVLSNLDTVITTIYTENCSSYTYIETDSLSDGVSFFNKIDTSMIFTSTDVDTVQDTNSYVPLITVNSDTTYNNVKDTTSSETSEVLVNLDTVITTIYTENCSSYTYIETDSLSDGVSFFNKIDTSMIFTSINIDTIKDTVPYDPPVAIEEIDNDPVDNIKELVFAPNPVPADAEELFFVTPSELKGEWEVTIFDNIGNVIDRAEFTSNGGYVYKWDLRNMQGIKVTSATYLAQIIWNRSDGSVRIFKRYIGVEG